MYKIFNVKRTSCEHCVEDLSNPLFPVLNVSHIKDYNDVRSPRQKHRYGVPVQVPGVGTTQVRVRVSTGAPAPKPAPAEVDYIT